jgi:multiple sugar transport system ATP-binding protein
VELPSISELGLDQVPADHVKLGIRAEDVSIGSSDTTRGGFEARVGLLEPIGSDTFVELLVGDDRLVARVAPASAPGRGDLVWAHISGQRVHLFDANTGRRLNTLASRLVAAHA